MERVVVGAPALCGGGGRCPMAEAAGSGGDLPRTLALQLDPYTATPLWPDAVSIAALQARR